MGSRLAKLMMAVMVLSMALSACAQATPVPATAMPAATAQPSNTPEPTEIQPSDISLWAAGRVSEAGPPPDDWAAYSIIADKLKVNLDLVLMPPDVGEQNTKILAAAAANALPDIFFVNRDTWYKLVGEGMVAKVDDLLPLMPTRTASHYSDENRNRIVTIDGSMYGLPDPGQIPTTDGFVIRKDWLDKLGLPMPKTIDELMAVAKAFTEQDPDGNGQNDTYGFGAYVENTGIVEGGLGRRFDTIFGAYGVPGVWNVSDPNFGLNVRNPAFFEAVKTVKALVDSGAIHPDWPTLKKDDFRALWKQGKWGIMRENFAALSTASNYKDFDKNNPDGEWVVLPPPTGPNGLSSQGLAIQSARIYAISQKAIDEGKGPAIARLLEWMSSDEGYYLLGFGEKGVNYNLDKDGFITLEGIDPAVAWTAKEMQPLTQLANMVYIFSDVELHARYVDHKTGNGRTISPLAFLDGFTKQTWTQATAAAIINPPANVGDFTRYYNEGLMKFVMGTEELNEANWAAFLAGLDALGAKDLEAAARETLTGAGFLK